MKKTLIGIALALGLILSPTTRKTIDSKASQPNTIKYQIGRTKDVISNNRTFNNIIIGISSFDRNVQRDRDVLSRELPTSGRYKETGSPGFGEYQGAEIIGESNEQCVVYAKRITGINKSIGYAGTAFSEGDTPKVGSIGLQKYYGHAVVIERIEGDRITVTESNWIKGKITRRTLNREEIRGYIY